MAATQAGVTGQEFHDLLSSVNEQWEQVLDRTSPVIRQLRIAETDVEIALAGDELAQILLPAFEWHPPATGSVCATVAAWDAQATGVPLPPRVGTDDPPNRQWVLRRDGRPTAEVDWSSPEMVRTGNRLTGRHLLGVASVAALSPWEAGAPLRRQLWWALGPEVLFTHAGAVGSADGAALIMGASGAGKSATSLACLRAGMGFLSDDYCLVQGEPPVVHLLATTARVHRHELERCRDLGEPVTAGLGRHASDPEMKALLFLHRSVPERLLASAPVRVVLVPELGDETAPRLERLRPADALRAVAPAALWQMHLEADRELAALRKLLTAVPTYRLLLSRDRDANPGAVQEALTQAMQRSA